MSSPRVCAVVVSLSLIGCNPRSLDLGDWQVDLDETTLTVTHDERGVQLEDVEILVGQGQGEAEMKFGSFLFEGVEQDVVAVHFGRSRGQREVPLQTVDLEDDEGNDIGTLLITGGDATPLRLEVQGVEGNRIGIRANRGSDEPMLGLGAFAQDVDHQGETFPLWVQEPGVGKVMDDETPEDWFLTGTRHQASTPTPFLWRPEKNQGLFVDALSRVDADLGAADPDRFELVAWQEESLAMVLWAEESPLKAVSAFRSGVGKGELPPAWVFGPWLDAVRGSERVREVAAKTRAAGAPATAIWSEDWKGAVDSPTIGYHLTGDWVLDEALYPDAEVLAEELHQGGFRWLSYFSPFLSEGTEAFDDALAKDLLIHTADQEPYLFLGASFSQTSMIDLTNPAGRGWWEDRMAINLALGFDGWMADFAEWLPTDASLSDGTTGWETHNLWPELWQSTNRSALSGLDTTFFVRSTWSTSGSVAPILWGGDQQTSFGEDDGLATVVATGIGSGATGFPVYTHDIGGYSTVGVPFSTKELWFRWCSLGAWTPVMRTHHGAWDLANWSFDEDEETLAHWAATSREHVRVFPYRYGVAAEAFSEGTPMVRPPATAGETDWGRTDAWMLGEAFLVAPVVVEGATSREVELPGGVGWWTWPGLEPATSGTFTASVTEIPVFVREGSVIPTFETLPETLADGAAAEVVDLADVDGERVVYVFGSGGEFTEADGTHYRVSGTPTGAAEADFEGADGSVNVGGVTVDLEGTTSRKYHFVVAKPSPSP